MTDEVQTIYDNWGNRASNLSPEVTYAEGRIFKVGGYSIDVPNDPTAPAKVASLYNRWGRNENPMPNMSFSEGEMRIPVEDFADLILRRVPADELADGLMRDPSVREKFVYNMAHRWAGVMTDEDRRKFLIEIQEAIYSTSIDRAIEELNKRETNERSRADYYRWKGIEIGVYRNLYNDAISLIGEDAERLERFCQMHFHPDKFDEFIKNGRDPIAVESVGDSWHESREFWRKKLLEFLPPPKNAEDLMNDAN